MSISIAIDGPSGAGKSTLAKAISEKIGYIYFDTGALYRTVGLHMYNNDISLDDEQAVIKHLSNIDIKIKFIDGVQRMFLNNRDVSDEIRKHIISDYASKVSAIPAVRTFLFDMQREFAKNNNVVMDGRDIGSVVLPNAKIKIYLTASANDRARRRFIELKNRGKSDITYEQVLKDVIERDNRDINRPISPLKIADGAVVVDTSELNFEQSLSKLLEIIKERII